MSCVRVTNALVHTVESTCSLSNDSMISVELNSHADIFVVSSNVLAVHNHEHFIDVYGFDKETWHVNACTIDAVIAHKDPVMHLTGILIINQAIKIDSMHHILLCPMQCCVHGTTDNECPKFLSASPAGDNHALLVHDPDCCRPPLTIPLSLDSVTHWAHPWQSHPRLLDLWCWSYQWQSHHPNGQCHCQSYVCTLISRWKQVYPSGQTCWHQAHWQCADPRPTADYIQWYHPPT